MKRTAILLLLLALVPAAVFAQTPQAYSASLSGENEVPAGDPDGFGFAVITIFGTTMNYLVFYQNIGTPTAAHIHTGAAGVAGPVFIGLDTNMLLNGTAAITQAQADAINANPSGFYVNVHTAEFPDGAIRGQLVRAEGSGDRTSLLPIVGKVIGQNNTNFVTDLSIVNNGFAAAEITLDYFASNPAGLSGPSVTKTLSVLPGEQKVIEDVVGTTLGLTGGGFGALKVTSDMNVLVSARVFNDQRARDAGTVGFAMKGVEEGEVFGTITFLANNDDYRTNIGYFNPNPTPANASFTAHGSDGSVLGQVNVAIPANAMVQQPVFALISTVPASAQTQHNFYVTWDASKPLLVYGSVTDNKTGDAVLNQ